MKKLTLLVITLCFIFISNKSFSQDWLPKPVKSAYLDAMLGTWTSLPYEFMGNTSTEVVTYKMILNGQFLEIDFKSSDGKGFSYEGKEILVPSPDGSMKGTYYDIMGKEKSTSYTASADGSKIIFKSGSTIGEGTREIIIDGDTMIQNASFVMTNDTGSKSPEQKITITFKKSE
ncbi:MAG: hypothetical protein IPL53_24870 [Ignavibacteria bacterium]|nr:hypothetical protein [Ignavibacteria bacterium]